MPKLTSKNLIQILLGLISLSQAVKAEVFDPNNPPVVVEKAHSYSIYQTGVLHFVTYAGVAQKRYLATRILLGFDPTKLNSYITSPTNGSGHGPYTTYVNNEPLICKNTPTDRNSNISNNYGSCVNFADISYNGIQIYRKPFAGANKVYVATQLGIPFKPAPEVLENAKGAYYSWGYGLGMGCYLPCAEAERRFFPPVNLTHQYLTLDPGAGNPFIGYVAGTPSQDNPTKIVTCLDSSNGSLFNLLGESCGGARLIGAIGWGPSKIGPSSIFVLNEPEPILAENILDTSSASRYNSTLGDAIKSSSLTFSAGQNSDAAASYVYLYGSDGKKKYEFTPFGKSFKSGMKAQLYSVNQYANSNSKQKVLVVASGLIDKNVSYDYPMAHVVSAFTESGSVIAQKPILIKYQPHSVPTDPDLNFTVGSLNGPGDVPYLAFTKVMGFPLRSHLEIIPLSGSYNDQSPTRLYAPYGSFAGSLNIASGDIFKRGVEDIVLAPAKPGSGPHVKVVTFDKGEVLREFFAYDGNFTGGLNLLVADIDGAGWSNIITAPASNGGPHIRVWDGAGRMRKEFFSHPASCSSGVKLAKHPTLRNAVVTLACNTVRVMDLNTGTFIINDLLNSPGFSLPFDLTRLIPFISGM